MKIIYTIALVIVLAGCSAFEAINNNPAAADFVIKVATTQYIDAEKDPAKRLERAKQVSEKVEGFQSLLAGNPALSLDDMERQFRDSIDWAQMDVGDKILADALIQNVRLQLEDRVKLGQLSDDYTIAAKTLLNLILSASRLYGV